MIEMVKTLPQSAAEIENMGDQEFLNLVNVSASLNPNNRSTKFFTVDFYESLDTDQKRRVRQIMAPGLMSTDSKIGVYVRNPQDYTTFASWLGAIINDYHQTDLAIVRHHNDWDLGEQAYDLENISPLMSDVSMRIRTAAIPVGFNLPAEQTLEERVQFEERMVNIFDKLDGTYYSLTPDSAYQISPEQHQALVDRHYMFKDMTEDPHLKVSDLASDWPYGRGMFMKEVGGFKLIVWVGEEDLLRIMCMGHGSDIGFVFNQLKGFIDVLRENGLEPVQDEVIGNPTSCPSNIGTSMRASILFDTSKLPVALTKAELQEIAKPLGLQVRGLDGETSQGESPVFDISPSARFGVSQAELLQKFYSSLDQLVKRLNEKSEG